MTVAHPAVQALPVHCDDGHQFNLTLVSTPDAHTTLLFAPALGVSARHYLPFAHALSARRINVAIHEWRGHGSSNLRAARHHDWGFGQLLLTDLPASLRTLADADLSVDVLGGHSLGGQLSCCLLGLQPQIRQVWLVGAGSPWWRSFPAPLRWRLPLLYAALPSIARLVGHLPGQRLGFGGRESRSLIADWALVGRSGRYRVPQDIEQRMAHWDGACVGLYLANDWMAPETSLHALTEKLPKAQRHVTCLSATASDQRADHFSWMKAPGDVVEVLASFAKKSSQNR